MTSECLASFWPEWELVKCLGQGGCGTVYQARRYNNKFGELSAIKIISVLPDEEDPKYCALDVEQREAHLKARVDHLEEEIKNMAEVKGGRNVVHIEDHYTLKRENELGWDIFIRMELLDTLADVISEGQMTEKQVIKVGCDICTALETCGDIVHRDIKPQNIFVDKYGDFKLGDFGIAQTLERMNMSFSIKGTPKWMAPEVVHNKHKDARVDIYSLGLVLYYLLNGNSMPFLDSKQAMRSTQETDRAWRRRMFDGELLPPPKDASPEMADVILRACAYDKDRRFPNATEMKRALQAVESETAKKSKLTGCGDLEELMQEIAECKKLAKAALDAYERQAQELAQLRREYENLTRRVQ